MDGLDRALAESMHDAAVHAPSDAGLLAAVHIRSGRYRRRRIATGLSAAAVALAVAVPTAASLVTRPSTPAPPAGTAPIVSGPPAPSPSTAPPSVVSAPATHPSLDPPSHPTTTAKRVHLAAGYTAPVFPYTLPAVDGMTGPVASMRDGNLIAFFEATELNEHADITVTVSSRKPAFSGPATETPVQVRGHAGKLRTVDVQPARQLTVYWPEPGGRWIQLATDDTYTPQQVVDLADALTPASVGVLPPFRLDLSPAGFVTLTVTASTMSFSASATAPATNRITAVLRKRKPLSSADEKVGPYAASLTHDAGGAVLRVDVTDWDATLEITVGSGVRLSDADLLRFAAGVHILNRSNPQ